MLLLFVALPTLVQCFLRIPELDKVEQHHITSDPGEPLFVTPYLDTKEGIALVKKKAQVHPFVGDVKSYSGYFTVNKEYNSNLFFWFFQSENRPANDPVVLWLHGGPGQSSLRALFYENGPYIVVDKDHVMLRNETSWTKRFNVLYIDNPVGAGYSFTENSDGYSRTVHEAAVNLYEGLTQFFTMFYKYEANRFVLSGQSYGGKYIPVLAKLIHEKNAEKRRKVNINLKGLFIGCGYMNPGKQIQYADFLYQNGIIDSNNRDFIGYREQYAREAITNNKYWVATFHLAIIALKMVFSGYRPPVDVQQPRINLSSYERKYTEFIQRCETRAAIHVGSRKYHGIVNMVIWYFRADFYNSVADELSTMLNHYKVLLYAGQFDMIIPPSQIDGVIASLTWKGLNNFHQAEYTRWNVNGDLAGNTKTYSNLQQVLVRRSNHLIIGSQPVWLFDLLKQFCKKL